MNYHFQIYLTSAELPGNWNEIVAPKNILLSKEYFRVLEESKPQNMQCYFGAFFLKEQLIGGCLFQNLDFQNHTTFQNDGFKLKIKKFISKKLVRDVLILGNNMLTGQNAFYFDETKISEIKSQALLQNALEDLQIKIKKTSLIVFKDFSKTDHFGFEDRIFRSYFKFSVQPNMILGLKDQWKIFDDYQLNFSRKYRSRINTAQKKLGNIEKVEFDLKRINELSSELNSLYQTVAENATINTFFLPEDHFGKMKESLTEDFRVFGYFLEGKLIGFYTLILNGNTIDTYFLGYNKSLQKEKQLYLNMLLDMVKFGIDERFEKIIFGRTALEIKSTIGAEPDEIFGLIKHNNVFVNLFVAQLFPYLDPKTEWIQRKPFKG